jgi:aromatic ring-opening dioxygenase LigB subunit
MLMLEGALGGDGWKGELLSYEAPTYFGMLCAAYAQRANEGSSVFLRSRGPT